MFEKTQRKQNANNPLTLYGMTIQKKLFFMTMINEHGKRCFTLLLFEAVCLK